jgi:hypothetical protein
MLGVFAVNVAACGGLMTMFPVVATENQVGAQCFAAAAGGVFVSSRPDI